MLTLNNVSKNFGKFTAVENISLNMDNGLYALLAPNGAGKTTIIKMITTLLNPTEGEILYDGVNIKTMGAAYRELLGYLPQDFGYYKNNTPKQYLSYLAALKGVPKKETAEKIDYLLEMVGLSENADKKMRKFSGGMIQRVGIAQAMLNDPKILILDEPTAGLDPKERVRFRNIISVLSKDRIVILSTHIVSDIESIANQVILIRDKHIYKMDSVANICNELSGKVFEMQVSDKEYEKMEEKYIVLSARQEKGFMTIRVFDEADDGTDNDNKVSVSPNLEDVFLVNYN
ncbi:MULTISPECIES: ABC transporter ATP-binding protein [Eubacterium]|jgi:ABC-2 type transport system ATP-binding protein|uniref:ABC transporter ATP-binding protein n=1 Tax=Eubacterium album TaxID=2978477 RepID=A0ABT2M0K0_9FIRM|nr:MULTISPECIES: ABC transporter ATP-binding protein [unclassified Eubacterium (in: firmicutes)]MCT7398431.1 ABC transporter ATP-binding protein [Eubacterium sp. LFL-14]RHR35628.1 ABC transporter ATP-binding protein [Eubacterium sp. AF19-12LB]